MIKICIQYSEFRALSGFQGKHKLLKNLECKKYVQCSENFRANNSFSEQAQSCSNTLNGKKYIQRSENFQGKLCLSW